MEALIINAKKVTWVSEMTGKLHKLVNQASTNYYLLQLKRDQWKSTQELKNIQLSKLKAILKYAYDFIPYYHRLFSAAKIKPEQIRNYEDMQRIPLTSKQDVQKNFSEMVPRNFNTSKMPSAVTSGSTGIPLKFIRDASSTRFGYLHSVYNYIYFECGVRPKDNFVTVWGRDAKSIQWHTKYARLWGGISETVVPLFPPAKLIDVLRFIKPEVMNTFPSVLRTLSDYDVSGINPSIVFTQGELVTQHCRDIVKKMFGLALFETYGSVEFGNLAFECNEHCGLHVITNSALVEFISESGEVVSPGEQGEIVVTGFLNYAMPLIRYRIGDLGIQTDEKCNCGRSWPLIKNIQGRINDYFVLPSGRKISYLYLQRGIFHKTLRENVFAISQYQKGKTALY